MSRVSKIVGLSKIFYLVILAFFMCSADYETLRALDSNNSSSNPSMSDDEINALPLHQYKAPGLKR